MPTARGELGERVKRDKMMQSQLPLTGDESGGRVQDKETDAGRTDVMLSLGAAGGSLSRVFPVTSGDEGPAPFVLNAWIENVYIVAFLRPATTASSFV